MSEITINLTEVLEALNRIYMKILSGSSSSEQLTVIVKNARNVFKAESCNLQLFNSATKISICSISAGLSETGEHTPRENGIGYRAIKKGVCVWEKNPSKFNPTILKEKVKCVCACPLKDGSAIIAGVLYLHFAEDPKFSKAQNKITELFSNLAGLAINIANLRENDRIRIEDLELLRKASLEIAKVGTLRESLLRVVQEAKSVMHANAAILYPYDEKTGKFKRELVTSNGIDMRVFVFENPRPTGTGLTQRLMRNEAPFSVMDVENISEKQNILVEKIRRHVMRPNRLRSFIGVGLKSDQERLGVLYVFFKEPHEAHSDDLGTLSIFADLGSTRIQLAKLSDAIKRAAEADAMALFGIVATTLGHRFENVAGTIPLVIQHIEELLKELNVTNATIWERFDDLRSDVDRLLELKDSLPKKNVGRFAVNLPKVIDEAIKGSRLKKINPDIRVSVDVASITKLVSGVEALLVDMFINLLQNAAQANANSISIVAIEQSENKMIDVFVKDNGDGIAEEDLEKVFMPFFSTKDKDESKKSHGKGLWAAYHEINQMDGHISVKSKGHKKGATFEISLKIFDE